MTRYFYRCPIAAAKAEIDHGIMIENWNVVDLLYHASCLYDPEQSPSDPVQTDKFYIAPESEYLLQPMAGDICAYQTFDEKGDVILRYSSYDEEAWEQVGLSIIMRNNLPFIAPEVEG